MPLPLGKKRQLQKKPISGPSALTDAFKLGRLITFIDRRRNHPPPVSAAQITPHPKGGRS
jgi:hypothetical protein